MDEDDATGDFVHILAAGAAGPYEPFLKIRFMNAQGHQAILQNFGGAWIDGKIGHNYYLKSHVQIKTDFVFVGEMLIIIMDVLKIQGKCVVVE